MWGLRLPPVSTRDCRLNSSTISLMNEEEVKSCFVSLESDGSKIEFFHKYLVMSIFPCIWHSSRCATPNLIEIVQQNADDHRQNVKSRGQPIPSYPASRPRLVFLARPPLRNIFRSPNGWHSTNYFVGDRQAKHLSSPLEKLSQYAVTDGASPHWCFEMLTAMILHDSARRELVSIE